MPRYEEYQRKLAELRREIDKGMEDVAAGRIEYGSFSEMIKEYEAQLAPKSSTR